MSVQLHINSNMESTLRSVRDLDTSEMRSIAMDLIYENECVVFRTGVIRTFSKIET